MKNPAKFWRISRLSSSKCTKRECSTSDMNPGNVFFYKSGEKYRFALIDINRIRFCRHLTRNDCVEVFKHLDNLPPPALSVVLVRYAELRQWNPQILCGAVMLRQGVNLPRRIKTGFRSLLSHLGLRK